MHTRLTSQTFPAAFFPTARGESAPAAGLTHTASAAKSNSVVVGSQVSRFRANSTGPNGRSGTLLTGLSVGSDRQLSGRERPRPLVYRRGGHAAHVRLDQVPAHRLGEKRHRSVTNQHRLRLQVLLVPPRRLGVGSRDPDKVVVLLALPEGEVVRARGEEDVVPVRLVGIVGAPTVRPGDRELSAVLVRAESVGVT